MILADNAAGHHSRAVTATFGAIITQITIDLVFSLDSIMMALLPASG